MRFFPKPYSSTVSGEKHQPSPVGRPLLDAHPILLGLPSPPARLPLCQHPCRACATHGPERGPLRSHTPESLDSPERPPSAPGPARGPRGLWACCLLASSGLWQLFPSLLRTWPVLRGTGQVPWRMSPFWVCLKFFSGLELWAGGRPPLREGGPLSHPTGALMSTGDTDPGHLAQAGSGGVSSARSLRALSSPPAGLSTHGLLRAKGVSLLSSPPSASTSPVYQRDPQVFSLYFEL